METGVLAERQGSEVLTGDYVAAELNLESIGYFSAGYKRKYPSEEQKSKIISLNHDRRIEIIPNLKYGFPNSEDQDFYRAFLKICDEKINLVSRRKDGQLSVHPSLSLPIAFHSRELIRKAGRAWSSRDLQSVRDWIKRSTSTVIEGELYRAKTKEFSKFGGPLFSQHILVGERMRNGKVADMNFVWPAPWFLSNFYYRYVRPIDLAFHQRLRKPIAKTLYPILDTGWYAAQGGDYAKRYEDLCSLFFIPTHQHLSLVKQQLDPSHEELQREHFLACWEYTKNEDGEWTGVIRWWPGKKWFHDQGARKSRKELVERYGSALPLPGTSSSVALNIKPDEHESSGAGALNKGSAEAEKVRTFYARLGQPKISRQKLDAGVKVLRDLEGQGFSLDDIDVGLRWILENREQIGGTVYSLGLLPEVIGQALAAAAVIRKRDEKRQRDEDRQATQVHDVKEMEKLYQALPTAQQAALREEAIERLLQEGIKREFLLDGLVKDQIYRLLKSQPHV